MNQFDELVEEGHVAHDALFKIFTKKIKRSKKKDEGTACCSLLPQQHLGLDAIKVDQANTHIYSYQGRLLHRQSLFLDIITNVTQASFQ